MHFFSLCCIIIVFIKPSDFTYKHSAHEVFAGILYLTVHKCLSAIHLRAVLVIVVGLGGSSGSLVIVMGLGGSSGSFTILD